MTSGTTPTSFRYTGQREEISFGLYYYGARWYDPAIGRFTQADTIVPDPTDAKQYDRYAYVSNNPLKYTDPTGHQQYCVSDGESAPTACGYGSPNGGGGGGRAPRVGAGMGGVDDMEIESRPAAGGMSFFGRIGNGFRSVGNWVKKQLGFSEPEPVLQKGKIQWIDENASMTDIARRYNDSAAGARSNAVTRRGQAPALEYKTLKGETRLVKFDGLDEEVLIDRKRAVLFTDKVKDQALRQSEALNQNGYWGRWEVPNEIQARRAERLFSELGINNIGVQIVNEP